MRRYGLFSAVAVFSLISGLSGCKNNQAAATGPLAHAPAPAAADQKALKLADGSPAPAGDPYQGTGKDVYGMSRADLQRVPPGILEREVAILEARNEAEKIDLENIQAFNLAMCKRLQTMEKLCVAMLYITSDHGLDGINCTGNAAKSEDLVPEIRIGLQGSEDKSFMLIADSTYVSTEFTAKSTQPIQFQREDNKVIKPPRFRDLQSLEIVGIRPGGTRYDHATLPPLEQFKVKITVNGIPLLAGNEDGSLKLLKSDDPNIDWLYRIDPNGIQRLGRAPECTVSLKELRDLQENSKVR